MGESRVNLTHHFLIAMPSMADPHFAHTLIYVCEHNEKGALGIVINVLAPLKKDDAIGGIPVANM